MHGSFDRNNLGDSASPYLRQHKDNPVHWQEWSTDAIDYARSTGRIIFVSVGYATCHWCHVMAAEAFSDGEVAAYLNEHFVCIKVDREQRPDIDRYLMAFLTATTGRGGWPLNAFLSPDGRAPELPVPFFALTYAAVEPRYGMPGFQEILHRVRDFHALHRTELSPFDPGTTHLDAPGTSLDVAGYVESIRAQFDPEHGGFGTGQKFPPHATLLFLLHLGASELPDAAQRQTVDTIVRTTLDAMLDHGLHDHLQGGFFRYTVDRSWTIPHFEKMLYDQAMALWVLSAAAKRFDEDRYRAAALGVVRCLDETFAVGDLFISAHDADTAHQEGATYLWSYAELARILGAEDLELFERVFAVSEEGNFEKRNHLVRRGNLAAVDTARIQSMLQRLLDARRQRPQPDPDRKIVTSWNALAGIALVMGYRYLGMRELLSKAERVAAALMSTHRRPDGRIHHSSLDGRLQPEEFLEDSSTLLLLLTTLHQETGAYSPEIEEMRARVESHRSKGRWVESSHPDFVEVTAERFDHPVPSSTAIAERALLEAMIVRGETYMPRSFGVPYAEDFGNLTALIQGGDYYLIETPSPLPWSVVPLNTLQYAGDRLTTCYRGACRPGLVLPSQ